MYMKFKLLQYNYNSKNNNDNNKSKNNNLITSIYGINLVHLLSKSS